MFRWILWIFLLSTALFSAQDNRVSLNGAVQFEYKEMDYQNILVTNLNTGNSTLTNLIGQFSIKAKEGDILQFRGDNVQEDEAWVNANHIKKNAIFILLTPISIPLSEVLANNFKFSGNLAVDTKRAEIKDTLSEAIAMMGVPVGRARDEWKHINTPVFPSIVSMDLDALYDIISGEKKRKIALYNYNQKKNVVSSIRNYFQDPFFISSLRIPLTDIDTFLYTVIEISDLQYYFNQNDYYTIMQLLKELAPTYKERMQNRSNQYFE